MVGGNRNTACTERNIAAIELTLYPFHGQLIVK
jgi:hypothetical protein